MTSVSDAEAHNFGRAEHYDHATRYDRAAEYLDVVRWLTGFDGSRTIKVGDPMPNFALEAVNGTTIRLDSLIATGPAVLIFFRFAGCPACNIPLPLYQRVLWPTLRELGVPLVAISPQISSKLSKMQQRHALDFTIATDRDNHLASQLGTTFEANPAIRQAASTHLREVTGTGTWELPFPTTLVVDETGVVAWSDVTPDWMKRTEADAITDAVRSIIIQV